MCLPEHSEGSPKELSLQKLNSLEILHSPWSFRMTHYAFGFRHSLDKRRVYLWIISAIIPLQLI
jgi:hypothetical protein